MLEGMISRALAKPGYTAGSSGGVSVEVGC